MLTFPRVVKSPVNLGGDRMEPGTVVAACIYLTHQQEDLSHIPHPRRVTQHNYSEKSVFKVINYLF